MKSLAVLVLCSALALVPSSFLNKLSAEELTEGETPPQVVRLNGPIEGDFSDVLGQLKKAKGDVTLVITSEGGSVVDGMRFILAVEDIRAAKGLRVHCVADMFALSMGANIL
jgi:ATP-dependent protease ClpP protease subunit